MEPATRWEQPFLRERLSLLGGMDVIVPDGNARDVVHDIIFFELCRGRARAESRSALLAIIDQLRAQGAQGIILGCTELMLILSQDASPLPLFDTTALHAEALADYALADGSDSGAPCGVPARTFQAGRCYFRRPITRPHTSLKDWYNDAYVP